MLQQQTEQQQQQQQQRPASLPSSQARPVTKFISRSFVVFWHSGL